MIVIDPDELLLAIQRYLSEDEPNYIQIGDDEDDEIS
jgi:hypothetical protein